MGRHRGSRGREGWIKERERGTARDALLRTAAVVARLVTLDEFFEQFRDLRLDRLDGRPAFWSRPVEAPHGSTGALFPYPQESTLLKPMQQRVQGARPNVIAMVP